MLRRPLVLIDGVLSELPQGDSLPSDAVVLDALAQIQSTSLITGGDLTPNADPTKYDMSAGMGIVVDNFTDPEHPVKTVVIWTAKTGLTPAYINTDSTSYVAINASGTVVYTNTLATAEQRRDLIFIGWVDHTDMTNIGGMKVQPFSGTMIAAQLNDFFLALGAFNIDGNVYSPATGLQAQRSAGQTFDSNANYAASHKSPHILTTNLETPISLVYYYRDGAGGWMDDNAAVTAVDPNHWDDGSGTLALVPAGKWTVQVIAFYAQTLSNDFQYGQHVYDTYDEAKTALSAAVDIDPYNAFDTFRGWLVVQQGCTDLTDVATAEFVSAGKLGLVDVASGGGSGGEANTGTNVGTGASVFKDKLGVALRFKTITGSGQATVTETEDTINIEVADSGNTQNVFISDTPPASPPSSYLWIQTGMGADGAGFTFWIGGN